MRFERLTLKGLVHVRAVPASDQRGSFFRAFCADSFRAEGLETGFVQDSVSTNHAQGTLRGMHFQKVPHGETKLVQCLNGAIFDVAVDLRPQSPTFGRWQGVTLSAQEPGGLYIPDGFAHGFLTLTPDALVYYKITPAYVPGQEGGLRWDDVEVGIAWPSPPVLVSSRDAALPVWRELSASLAKGSSQ